MNDCVLCGYGSQGHPDICSVPNPTTRVLSFRVVQLVILYLRLSIESLNKVICGVFFTTEFNIVTYNVTLKTGSINPSCLK